MTNEESLGHFKQQQKRYMREHNGTECPHYSNAIYALGQIERLTAENAALKEANRWVPVTSRLPEPEMNVLIWQTYKGDAPYANITIGHLHQEGDLRRKPYWMWIAHGADMVNPKIEAYHRAEFICPGNEFVTHWMPLPEPPQKG